MASAVRTYVVIGLTGLVVMVGATAYLQRKRAMEEATRRRNEQDRWEMERRLFELQKQRDDLNKADDRMHAPDGTVPFGGAKPTCACQAGDPLCSCL